MAAADGAGNHGAAAESPELRRTPHLDLPVQPLSPGEAFDVVVWADTEALAPGETGNEIVLSAGRLVSVKVKIVASAHFELVDGGKPKSIILDPAQDTTEKLPFALRVVDAPPSDATPWISAHFWKDAQRCGWVSRNVKLAVPTRAPAKAATSGVVAYVSNRFEADLLVSIETASPNETNTATMWGCTVVTAEARTHRTAFARARRSSGTSAPKWRSWKRQRPASRC
jgi:hypothetical protein